MKTITSQLLGIFQHRVSTRNVRMLRLYLLVFVGMVGAYTGIFHWLMAEENQKHSWFTGLYWTLSTMSTLGYGDVSFTSDAGRAFSVLVLMSGMVFLLVMLPFTFIEFFYAPWMQAQEESRAPRRLKGEVSGHVIITNYTPVTAALIVRLRQYGVPYVLIVREVPEALKFHDEGINVIVGEPDFPDVYERARIDTAAMVTATSTDTMNTNIAFTVRQLATTIPIVTTASDVNSMDVLQFAGASHVIRLSNLMGQWLARRTIGGDAEAHVIGTFDELQIAEATAAGTPLVGKRIGQTNLREMVGVSVVGVWDRGQFTAATSRTEINSTTVLVLAGSQDQLSAYDAMFCIYHRATAPVIIIGGGRVGRATGRALEQREVDFKIVERRPERIRDEMEEKYVLGNASDIEVLESAGIREAPAVIITSHEDDVNIYLTIYCRKLRPDIEIISRCTQERNVNTMHRAGADFVMSNASMGANIMFNLLRSGDLLMLAEGLDLFRVDIPARLVGKPIKATSIREETGCTIVALSIDGKMIANPEPDHVLEADTTMVLIGTAEAESEFLNKYPGKNNASVTTSS
ncbi:MAG: potassium transporter TrkA [Verrucomicrobiales bacterium]|nr:potassium transporter TrkA [Verrucomicrobiales bacterium]|tara:strand:- start:314 stop:2038 length:1725 start_codon:yes stop_codon:yes gene_type:complete